MDFKNCKFDAQVMDISKFCNKNVTHMHHDSTEIIPSPTSDTQWSGYSGRFEEAHEAYNSRDSPTSQLYASDGPMEDRQQFSRSTEGFSINDAHSVSNLGQGSLFSQYAMDAIFKNLIYPDVSQSCSLSLDSLLSVSGETVTETNHCLSLQTVPDKSRYGKRKRMHVTNNSKDSENGLGQTCESGVRDTAADRRTFNVRRTLVHKRVRQLICDM